MSTRVLAVTAEESVLLAWELMQQGHYHHLPVIDTAGHCIGVLSAETLARNWPIGGPDQARRPVKDLLTGPLPPALQPDDPVTVAAREMLHAKTDFVPVADADGRLVGLLTTTDLIAALAGEKEPFRRTPNVTPTLFRLEPVIPQVQHPEQSPLEPD
jgi:CBS domain-containing membrane protein